MKIYSEELMMLLAHGSYNSFDMSLLEYYQFFFQNITLHLSIPPRHYRIEEGTKIHPYVVIHLGILVEVDFLVELDNVASLQDHLVKPVGISN